MIKGKQKNNSLENLKNCEKKVEWSQDYYCDVVDAAGRTRQMEHGKSKG